MREKLFFPPEFFEDEVREGFFVSSMMKRFWAEQLEVLSVFSGICEKHSIIWYAGDGTLLGAARHKGYIPWDDDFDVYIMRDDAICFREAAKTELPDGYNIYTTEADPSIVNSLIRLVNGDHIRLSLPELEQHHGCPYVAGIDIFLLDGVFPEPEKEEERENQIKILREAAKSAKNKETDTDRFQALLEKIESTHGISLKASDDIYRDLRILKERVYASCPTCDADKLVLFWEGVEGDYYYNKEWFSETIDLPFETTSLPAPVAYRSVLKAIYGDWKKVVKEGGGHGYPCYNKQQDKLEDNTHQRALAYTFSADDILTGRPETRHAQMRETAESVLAMRDKIVQLKKNVMSDIVNSMKAALEQAEHNLLLHSGGRDWVSGRQEILFLPVRGAWWPAMQPFYDRCIKIPDADVYVMPLPWYDKQLDGSMGDKHDESALIENYGVQIIRPDDYDVAARCPDIIVSQFPFDGYSLYMTIPPFFS